MASGYKTSAGCVLRAFLGGRLQELPASLAQIDSGGAEVFCPTPIPVGVEVGLSIETVQMPEQRARVVSNAGDTGRGYRLGLQLLRQSWPYQAFAALMSLPLAEEESATPECLAELGLSLPCTPEDVEHAFYRLVRHAHPDRGGDVEAFVRLRSAYLEALDFVGGRR